MYKEQINHQIKLPPSAVTVMKDLQGNELLEKTLQECFPTSSIPLYLNEKQVSFIIGKAIPTLRNDRFLNRGIPYYKISRSVRYKFQDVIDFMESKKITPGVR
jgi:hypothetical protein